MEGICLDLLEFRMFSGMTHIALKLLDLVIDQQVKDTVAVRAAKTAVFHKIIVAGAAGRADNLAGLFFLIGFPLYPQKA